MRHESVVRVVRVELRIDGQRVVLVGDGRIDQPEQQLPLPRVGRHKDRAVGHGHVGPGQPGQPSGRGAGHPPAAEPRRLLMVKGEQGAPARVPKRDDRREAPVPHGGPLTGRQRRAAPVRARATGRCSAERVPCVQTARPRVSSSGTRTWWVTSCRGCVRHTTVRRAGTVRSTPLTVAPSEVVSWCTDVDRPGRETGRLDPPARAQPAFTRRPRSAVVNRAPPAGRPCPCWVMRAAAQPPPRLLYQTA